MFRYVSIVYLLLVLFPKNAQQFNVKWNDDGYNVRRAIPRDVIVDLINNFGLELLQVRIKLNQLFLFIHLFITILC